MPLANQNTLRKLALAKQLFLTAQRSAANELDLEKMLSIINLDFAVGSIIATACLDLGKNPKRQNGRAKSWGEVVDMLSDFYQNDVMIIDLNNLHELRNSIQHGEVVPSDSDVTRHIRVVREFFDEICKTVYDNQLSFDSISMARLLASPDEQMLMSLAEEFSKQKEYALSLMYLQITVLYHYLLIKSNLFNEVLPMSAAGFLVKDGESAELTGKIHDVEMKLDRAMARLAMGVHYMRALDFISHEETRPDVSEPFYSPDLESAYGILQAIKSRALVDIQTVESAFVQVYNILLGTHHLITEKKVADPPIVSGLYQTEVTDEEATLNFVAFSGRPIEELKLRLTEMDRERPVLVTHISLERKTGHQSIRLRRLRPKTLYKCEVDLQQPTSTSKNVDRAWNVGIIYFKTTG